MFRILCDPSSGSIKSASLELLVMFCVRSSVFGSVKFGPVVCVSGAAPEIWICCVCFWCRTRNFDLWCVFMVPHQKFGPVVCVSGAAPEIWTCGVCFWCRTRNFDLWCVFLVPHQKC